MKKQVFGRHLKRDANERKALFKNLLTSLVIEERITTTEAKAKAIKGAADKLVTKAKKAMSADKQSGPDAIRSLAPDIRYDAVIKLVNTIAPRFVNRQGGYTRIIKVGRRVADNAPQVVMEWVDRPEVVADVKAKSKDKKKNDKKEVKDDKNATAAVAKPVHSASSGQEKEVKVAKPSALKQLVTRQKKG